MNKSAGKIIGLLLPLLLTGCWDSEYLKDANLANGVGYDLTTEGKLIQTVELVVPHHLDQDPVNEIYSGSGKTPRETSDSLRRTVTGNIRYLKYGFLLLGQSLAEKDLYPYLDVSYRDPTNPTANVKLIVVEGSAEELLQKQKIGKSLIGEFVTQKVKSLEQMSIFPDETLETIFPKMMDPGQDFVLPFLQLQGKKVAAKGNALFHKQRMSGALSVNESILYTLLSGESGKNARFTRKVNDGSADDPASYISIDAGSKKKKRTLQVTVRPDGTIEADLKLHMNVVAIEYPKGGLNASEVRRINKVLTDTLTKEAEVVVKKLQKANCDAFGIGRKLIAHHSGTWKRLNWDTDYEKVLIRPEVRVRIVQNGLLK